MTLLCKFFTVAQCTNQRTNASNNKFRFKIKQQQGRATVNDKKC